MLELNGISKNFGSLKVLDNISLHVEKNEFVSVVGASGCGKTTLLRMISGLIRPEKGSVKLNEKEVKCPTRKIGVVFQEYTSFQWLTVKENIEFGLKLLGNVNKQVVENYLEIMGLKKFENTYPGRLSGGMRQRVAIARTLAVNPDIILMDEPFGSLDAQTREKMQDFLLKIWQADKKTIIFITHDIDEAILLSDRIIILSKSPAHVIKEFRLMGNRPRHNHEFFELKLEIKTLLKSA